MLLFKHEHEAPILRGEKTETRRLWKRPRVRVGAIHRAYTRPAYVKPPGRPFAAIVIRDRWVEPLVAIDERGARAEGYASVADYFDAFCRINRLHAAFDLRTLVWVVRFELAVDLREARF